MSTHALDIKLKLILIIMAAAQALQAQPPIRLSVRPPQYPDSIDLQYYGHKDPLQATATVIGLNTAVWSFDHFIRHTDYSDISFKTIADNFKEGFKWDNDHIGTNMFMHPYHGNLYFNAARSNGFNFWQSSLFAFGGSALWEMCMENEYPSTNDIIATPVGGTALGEVAFRASDIILDDRTTGWGRLGREAAVFIISPMRGLTRIINGDAWRHRSTSGRQFGIPNVAIEASMGVRLIGYKNQLADHGTGMTAQVNVEYGDRFELSSTTPYDYFNIRVDLAAQASQPVLSQVNVMGRLISRGIFEKDNHEMSIGLYQQFDFYDSDTIGPKSDKTPYKLGIPASVGAGWLYRYFEKRKVALDAYAHINGVMLGGVLSDHYNVDDRNYNLASGFSAKAGINLVFGRDVFSASLGYEYYRLFTWGYKKGTDLQRADPRTLNAAGDDSVAFFGIGDLRVDYRLARHLYLTGSITHYQRSTHYRDFPNVRSATFSARLMLTVKI